MLTDKEIDRLALKYGFCWDNQLLDYSREIEAAVLAKQKEWIPDEKVKQFKAVAGYFLKEYQTWSKSPHLNAELLFIDSITESFIQLQSVTPSPDKVREKIEGIEKISPYELYSEKEDREYRVARTCWNNGFDKAIEIVKEICGES